MYQIFKQLHNLMSKYNLLKVGHLVMSKQVYLAWSVDTNNDGETNQEDIAQVDVCALHSSLEDIYTDIDGNFHTDSDNDGDGFSHVVIWEY